VPNVLLDVLSLHFVQPVNEGLVGPFDLGYHSHDGREGHCRQVVHAMHVPDGSQAVVELLTGGVLVAHVSEASANSPDELGVLEISLHHPAITGMARA
jgi:hypothetical protein